MNEAAHRANYEHESKQKTMTALELHTALGAVIAAGHGHRPAFIMVCDGLTHAVPITGCDFAQPYDGDVVWIYTDDAQIGLPRKP